MNNMNHDTWGQMSAGIIIYKIKHDVNASQVPQAVYISNRP